MKLLKYFLLFVVSNSILTTAWGVQNLQTCFSPGGNCDQVIVGYINSAKKTIDMAIYNLSLKEIHDALAQAKQRGVKIRLVVDREQALGQTSQTPSLIQEGFQLRYGSQKGVMHNKFTLVDGTWLETGSYNYSISASNYNAENQIYLNDPEVVSHYAQDFETIWSSGLEPGAQP